MKRKFAVFDIDGTIARNALFLQIVDQLIANKNLDPKYREELDKKYTNYLHRSHQDAFKEYTSLSVDVLFKNMKTLKTDEYRKAVDEVIKNSAKNVYVYTRQLILDLQKQGYFIIALSGSEMYAVQEFTKQFNFDIAVGENYHEKDGFLTGNVDNVFDRKDKFIKQFVEEHNLTYEDSYAVGDSLSDASMLKMVENPIAFNPEDNLFEEAKKQGWKIVVERKNVIYELSQNTKGGYELKL